ncbi:MAG: hypothetical protein VX936_06735, partial [Planctomycetota bacterium]|nr:hypothetical protein [Planctomycetota bacterium]
MHSMQQAQLIRDFCPSVWIKSNHDHLVFSVRVVLPNNGNPLGEGPLKVLVNLDRSAEVNRWEQLGCRKGDLIRRFNARLRSIQFKFRDLKIDSGDAYCDLLVLSGFRKPDTEYQLWIDDIAVTGFLPARIARREQGSQQAPVRNPTRVAIEGSCWTIAGKPFFIRAVEHNGESFAFLRQLGFNSVLLKRHPTLRELEQAQQYQLWILCPPISRGPTTDSLLSSRNIEMVLAWNLGCDLTSNVLDLAQAQVDALESVEDLIDRPVFCHA